MIPQRKSIHGDELLRQRGCVRKTKFATEEGATLAMETMRRTQGKKHTKKLNTYHCRFCHCWHVGRNRFQK